MNETKLIFASPEIIEKQRIDEIRKLTPQQSFHRLMAIIELSYKIKMAKKYHIKDDISGTANS